MIPAKFDGLLSASSDVYVRPSAEVVIGTCKGRRRTWSVQFSTAVQAGSSLRRMEYLVRSAGNLIIGVACALMLSLTPAAAKRVALVVGINTYDNLNPEQQLKKAVNDARAVAATFKEVGFEVIVAENAKREAFLKAWQRFLDTVQPGDVTAVYFAGHGFEKMTSELVASGKLGHFANMTTVLSPCHQRDG